MIKVEVVVDNDKWKKKIKSINLFFNKVLNSFPKKYKYKKKKVIFSLFLSDNKRIKKLNKEFRNKNKPTDVLSFPLHSEINNKYFYLGDIIISYEFMNFPRDISKLNFKKKVTKIFIHGFLHLIGYDHIKDKDYNKMNKEENKIFNLIENKIEKINSR